MSMNMCVLMISLKFINVRTHNMLKMCPLCEMRGCKEDSCGVWDNTRSRCGLIVLEPLKRVKYDPHKYDRDPTLGDH